MYGKMNILKNGKKKSHMSMAPLRNYDSFVFSPTSAKPGP